MPAQIANLFLLEDLEYVSGTRELAESDRNALRAVADWTKTFVARPHRDLGRDGPVCPFVPLALEHATQSLLSPPAARRRETASISCNPDHWQDIRFAGGLSAGGRGPSHRA